MPEIVLRTTFIVGFPTESDAEFEQLLNFISQYRLDKVGAFKYSREEGTSAAKLQPQVPDRIKQKRYNTLMRLQKSISKGKNQRLKGKVLRVLVEGFDLKNGLYVGRSEKDAPFVDGVIKFTGKDCNLGQIYPVKVVEAYEYDLLGEVLNDF